MHRHHFRDPPRRLQLKAKMAVERETRCRFSGRKLPSGAQTGKGEVCCRDPLKNV
jgi:hypothetical protein